MLVYLQVMEAPADKGKFERLYAQYQGLMYHIAYDILRNRHCTKRGGRGIIRRKKVRPPARAAAPLQKARLGQEE